MTDHSWLEFAAPYALGALDADERARFETHLADCATCRADVQSFREATGVLARAAPPATPPPGLRERVLREARQVRPIAPHRRTVLPWVIAAAAAIVALVAGNAYRDERAARERAAGALAAAERGLDERDSLVVALLSPDAATAALAATGQPPAARLYWIPSRHRVVMAVYRLPPAPAGRIYQLWGIAGGKPVSLGLFNTGADGSGRVVLDVPPTTAFQVTAVTEEPAGGSPQPTQQPFLVGQVTGTK